MQRGARFSTKAPVFALRAGGAFSSFFFVFSLGSFAVIRFLWVIFSGNVLYSKQERAPCKGRGLAAASSGMLIKALVAVILPLQDTRKYQRFKRLLNFIRTAEMEGPVYVSSGARPPLDHFYNSCTSASGDVPSAAGVERFVRLHL